MPAIARSGSLFGLTFTPVDIEVDIQNGLPKFVIVGLPDASLQEARDRVTSALKNSGFGFPRTHVLANLAPADVRKEGPGFDVPLALAVLAADGVIPAASLRDELTFGELALDGSLRPVSGILPLLLGARKRGFTKAIIPLGNETAAALCPDLEIRLAGSIADIVRHLKKELELPILLRKEVFDAAPVASVDLADISGQQHAKRALEIAAAGGHNILFSGPPGSGKTMLARALPSILPPLSDEERLEVAMIHSLGNDSPLTSSLRPFRDPHHTTSPAALLGGARLKPGEATFAHRGVLFLDEFPEFRRDAIENLRQPLEDGLISISRAGGNVRYPARFQLVAAMNPCPCGYAGDGSNRCECSSARLLQYAKKISGPIKDRIDLHVSVPRVPTTELMHAEKQESSDSVRARVLAARELQTQRFADQGIHSNQEMTRAHIKRFCVLPESANALFEKAVDRLGLSARAMTRVLKVARTIADLAGRTSIESQDLAEALQYREEKR